ncbi:MAG TPA: ABC transporter ATP-binding protein [Anaerolineae bacterium]|nr:ABC transporter ATP-binding protein [Anaerolineae bacterium]
MEWTLIAASETRTAPRTATPLPILRVEDVFKIYKEGAVETVALRGASLELRAGEFVALLGKSGSGKSTLLNLIAGIDQPSAGRIWLGEHEITRLDPEARAAVRRRMLGFVFQTDNLIPFLSARENVQLPLALGGVHATVARERSQELLTQVGLAERQDHRLAQLSGGEAQRAGIACALANHPALVLADELTGELDSVTAAAVLDLIESIHRSEDTAFFVVTHNRQVAARAQRILHIQDGVIAEEPHA